jgi:hypothetical protein
VGKGLKVLPEDQAFLANSILETLIQNGQPAVLVPPSLSRLVFVVFTVV